MSLSISSDFAVEHDDRDLRKLRIFVQASSPSSRGIIRSSTIRSGVSLAASSTASMPSQTGHDLVAVVFQIEFNALDEQLFIIYNQNFHSLSST